MVEPSCVVGRGLQTICAPETAYFLIERTLKDRCKYFCQGLIEIIQDVHS